MPNRIIKESAFESEKIASLSDFEFRLWVGLITQADDAGRGDARPAIIKGHVFALRDRVTIKDIDAAVHALAAAGCVSLYTVGGKPYYEFPSWSRHQRIRDCKPKYPGIDEADLPTRGNSPQSAATRGNSPQSAATRGNSPQSAATRGLNPIQSESESESNTGSDTRAARFTPPTLPEVERYVSERNSAVDAKRFWEYYQAGGWKDSKGKPVKNWKQKLLTWEREDGKKGVNPDAGKFANLDSTDAL